MIVGSDTGTVEFGWPIGMPTCRAIREGVLEVRSTIKQGTVEVRTYFAVAGTIMLLLHGEVGKNGQQEAIRIAIRRWRDHLERSKRLRKADRRQQK